MAKSKWPESQASTKERCQDPPAGSDANEWRPRLLVRWTTELARTHVYVGANAVPLERIEESSVLQLALDETVRLQHPHTS